LVRDENNANWQGNSLAVPALAVSALGFTFVEELKHLITAIF